VEAATAIPTIVDISVRLSVCLSVTRWCYTVHVRRNDDASYDNEIFTDGSHQDKVDQNTTRFTPEQML